MAHPHEKAFLEALQTVGLKPTPAVDFEKEAESGATSQNIWRHPDAHPVVLDYLLLQKYGVDWMNWEPETLELRIPQDFSTQTLSDLNLSKIQACKTLHFVDTFWQRWEVFAWCAMTFNGVFPDFQTMQVPTVAQAAVAVDIARRLRTDVEYSLEMKTYLGVVHRHDGVLVPIAPLDFVHVDVSDVNVDAADIRHRWTGVRTSGMVSKAATMEDEQLRRMLIVHHFLEESRTRLRQQLRLVLHA